MTDNNKGVIAALLSPFFLGVAPVLGKFALEGGAEPFTVAALRTGMVVLLLWTGYFLFWRKYIFIYWAGFIACAAIGFTNGIGSLFYYSGLDLLDASVAQLINAMYIVFVVILTRMDGTKINRSTITRVMVAFLGILLITGGLTGSATWLGIGFMMGNALLFAGTVVMSQRVLYEMPAQTVTLYVMSAMASVVLIARFISRPALEPIHSDGVFAIVFLGVTTALSRLMLFIGVKGVGSLRTALAAIAEGAVAVSLAFIFLDESLSVLQWGGVTVLVASLFIPTGTSEQSPMNLGRLPNIAGIRFQRMAGYDSKISTQEMEKLVGLLVGDPNELNEQQTTTLIQLLGDEGYNKLQELATRYTDPQRD